MTDLTEPVDTPAKPRAKAARAKTLRAKTPRPGGNGRAARKRRVEVGGLLWTALGGFALGTEAVRVKILIDYEEKCRKAGGEYVPPQTRSGLPDCLF